MNDATRKLDNLTNALVEDILKAPDEEVLADALIALVQKERARATAAEARAQSAEDRERILRAIIEDCRTRFNGPMCAKAVFSIDDQLRALAPSTEETT